MENNILKIVTTNLNRVSGRNTMAIMLSGFLLSVFTNSNMIDQDFYSLMNKILNYVRIPNTRNLIVLLMSVGVMLQVLPGNNINLIGTITNPFSEKSLKECAALCLASFSNKTCKTQFGIVVQEHNYDPPPLVPPPLTINKLSCLTSCINGGGFNIALLKDYNTPGAIESLITIGGINDLMIVVPNEQIKKYINCLKNGGDCSDKDSELTADDIIKSILFYCPGNDASIFGRQIKYIALGWECIGEKYDGTNYITFGDMAKAILNFKDQLEKYSIKVGWGCLTSVKLTTILSPNGLSTDGCVPDPSDPKVLEWGCFCNYDRTYNPFSSPPTPNATSFMYIDDDCSPPNNQGFKKLWCALSKCGPFCINYFILPLPKITGECMSCGFPFRVGPQESICNNTFEYLKASYFKSLLENTFYDCQQKLINEDPTLFPIPLFVTSTGWSSGGNLNTWQCLDGSELNRLPVNFNDLKKEFAKLNLPYTTIGLTPGNEVQFYNNMFEFSKTNIFGPTDCMNPRIYFYDLIDAKPILPPCNADASDASDELLCPRQGRYSDYYGIFDYYGVPKGIINFPSCTTITDLVGNVTNVVGRLVMMVIMVMLFKNSNKLM